MEEVPRLAVEAPHPVVWTPQSEVEATHSACGTPQPAAGALQPAVGAPQPALGAQRSVDRAQCSLVGAQRSFVGAQRSFVVVQLSAATLLAVTLPWALAFLPAAALGTSPLPGRGAQQAQCPAAWAGTTREAARMPRRKGSRRRRAAGRAHSRVCVDACAFSEGDRRVIEHRVKRTSSSGGKRTEEVCVWMEEFVKKGGGEGRQEKGAAKEDCKGGRKGHAGGSRAAT
eukprot:355705-Chlamydomonas_euryale.AAC.3